jgi:predicted protein tyrosine phosphatase
MIKSRLDTLKSNKLREPSAEESFVDFVQKGSCSKSNKLREPSAEEFFVDFVQKGSYQ